MRDCLIDFLKSQYFSIIILPLSSLVQNAIKVWWQRWTATKLRILDFLDGYKEALLLVEWNLLQLQAEVVSISVVTCIIIDEYLLDWQPIIDFRRIDFHQARLMGFLIINHLIKTYESPFTLIHYSNFTPQLFILVAFALWSCM